MENPVPHTYEYETVAAGAANQKLGATGARGDLLERLICTVATAATSTVSLQDGNDAAIPILAANTPIGVYTVVLRMRARDTDTPGWNVTTGAGVSAIAVGQFT